MHRRGFSLLELSVALVIVGLVAGLALQLKQSSVVDCQQATKTAIEAVDVAVKRFAAKNDRLPLPAVRTAGVEDVSFGREAPLSQLDIDGSGKVVFGAVPFQALELAPSYAADCWGNKLSYAVTIDLTDKDKFLREPPQVPIDGAIILNTSASTTISATAAYAVVSHGLNATGSVKNNYRDPSNTDRRWCSAGSTLDSENCDVANAVVMAATFNDGKDAGAATFDDVVVFSGKPLRALNGRCNNSVPLGCNPGIVANDGGQTGCGTTRTWHCNGANGGTDDTTCSFANAPCSGCSPSTLGWGGNCAGPFPATAHGDTSSPATTNTNATFTGTATATCYDGVFTPSGSCNSVPAPPATNGVCGTGASVPTCAAGSILSGSDNGATACGSTRIWQCAGTNGGSDSGSCSLTNAPCGDCAAQPLTWGGGCNGAFPATANGATSSPATTNTNTAYTGTATAVCSNGTLTASGSCVATGQVDGACDNGTAGACVAGTPSGDNGETACGTTRSWTCNGANGGANASCSKSNAACLPNNCNAQAESWGSGCTGNTPSLNDGASTSVSNTSSGRSGSVTMTCSNGILTQSSPACTVTNNCSAGTQFWGAGCSGSHASLGDGASTSISNAASGYTGSLSVTCNNGVINANGASCTQIIDGGWSGWGPCNAGTQTRTCTNPPPSGGGAGCSGPSSQNCAVPVDCTWNDWGGWGGCSASCGGGSQSRSRSNNPPSGGGAACSGPSSETQSCNPQPCPINGVCGGAGTCAAGSLSGDNGQTACGTTRTWNCNGSNGGGNASCSVANDACPPVCACSDSACGEWGRGVQPSNGSCDSGAFPGWRVSGCSWEQCSAPVPVNTYSACSVTFSQNGQVYDSDYVTYSCAGPGPYDNCSETSRIPRGCTPCADQTGGCVGVGFVTNYNYCTPSQSCVVQGAWDPGCANYNTVGWCQ